jgi:hypothetical protein
LRPKLDAELDKALTPTVTQWSSDPGRHKLSVAQKGVSAVDPKREQEVLAQVRECLLQIALELEASATAARNAAELAPKRDGSAMPQVQQLYSRLSEATFQLDRFKRTIEEALADDK